MSSNASSPESLFLRISTPSWIGTAEFQWLRPGEWRCFKVAVTGKDTWSVSLDFLVGLTLPQAMNQTKACGWTRCLYTERGLPPQE